MIIIIIIANYKQRKNSSILRTQKQGRNMTNVYYEQLIKSLKKKKSQY